MSNTLNVTARSETGSNQVKKLRRDAMIPAMLYGAGKDNVTLSVAAKELGKVVETGDRSVTLAGAVSEKAHIKDVQWNAIGSEILHVDFVRES